MASGCCSSFGRVFDLPKLAFCVSKNLLIVATKSGLGLGRKKLEYTFSYYPSDHQYESQICNRNYPARFVWGLNIFPSPETIPTPEQYSRLWRFEGDPYANYDAGFYKPSEPARAV